jgi:hypothetical protein
MQITCANPLASPQAMPLRVLYAPQPTTGSVASKVVWPNDPGTTGWPYVNGSLLPQTTYDMIVDGYDFFTAVEQVVNNIGLPGPIGTVRFNEGSTSLGTLALTPLFFNQSYCHFGYYFGTAVTHSIIATYSGDGVYAPSFGTLVLPSLPLGPFTLDAATLAFMNSIGPPSFTGSLAIHPGGGNFQPIFGYEENSGGDYQRLLFSYSGPNSWVWRWQHGPQTIIYGKSDGLIYDPRGTYSGTGFVGQPATLTIT